MFENDKIEHNAFESQIQQMSKLRFFSLSPKHDK